MAARALALALLTASASACASYVGSARDFTPAELDREPGWIAVRDVPWLAQHNEADCGAAAIGMVLSYWTAIASQQIAETLRPVGPKGIQARRLRELARHHGLAAFVVQGRLADLEHELRRGRPVLVGLAKPHRDGAITHYEVVVALHPDREIVVTLDPAEGWRQNSLRGFLAEWEPAGCVALVVARAASAPLP